MNECIEAARKALEQSRNESEKREEEKRWQQEKIIKKAQARLIKQSESIRASISRSSNPKEMLMLALKYIESISGDSAFYQTNITKLKKLEKGEVA